MPQRRAALLALLALPALATPGCSREIDLKQSLELTDVTSGWYDAGIVDGKNKLIPSATFRIHQKSSIGLARISLNALFRAQDGAESALDNDVYVQRVSFEDDRTPPITLRAENGYTAEPPQTRAEMLKHTQFRDMRVQILVKQGSGQWTDLGWIDIKRQLLTD